MNKQEFKQAFKLAQSAADLSKVSTDHLFGCGLRDFQPTVTTLDAVAALLRWQGLMFNGQWDMEAVNDIEYISRKKFNLVDGGSFTVIVGDFTTAQVGGIRAAARMFEAVQQH